MTRAVFEGVAFGFADGLDLMIGAWLEPSAEIRASGGGTRSESWLQILADVPETRIATVATEKGAAYGAALLAWGPCRMVPIGGTPISRVNSLRDQNI